MKLNKILAFIFLTTIIFFSCKNEQLDVVQKTKVVETGNVDKSKAFKKVDEMSLFPGCEDEKDYKKRAACANAAMAKYINVNLQYPKPALARRIEGVCMVNFVVQVDGSFTDMDVPQSIGYGTEKAAMAPFKKMMSEGLLWNPAVKNGEKVPMYYAIPIQFKMKN